MPTQPVRVPDGVHSEVQAAARVMGCTPAELLERAWEQYRATPEFRDDFAFAQKAFQVGDLEGLANRLQERGEARAAERAARVRSLRGDQ